MKVPQSLIVSHSRLLLCFMCCTTVLSMWLSNTSTTAMVMPIVEAVLQELVNAEEEHDVISTTGNTIIEENESIGICQYWSFFFSHLSVTRIIDIYYSNSVQVRAVWFVLPNILVHSFSFCMVIFLSKMKDSFTLKCSRSPNTCSVTIPCLPLLLLPFQAAQFRAGARKKFFWTGKSLRGFWFS